MAKRVGDLTGQWFGKLKVVSLVGKDKNYDKIWRCECKCGNIVDVKQGHLRSGHTTSCGCQKPQLQDLTGTTRDHLRILRRIDDYVCPGNGKHYVRYECQCECGKVFPVLALNLKNGSTKSCGCKSPKAFSDLSGQRFGLLRVKYRVDDYVNPSGRKLVRYLCECECGTDVLELANTLRNGDVESCGCVLRSRGEAFVREILDSRGITYQLHKTFDGCVSDAGNKLSYDFYLSDFNVLIECHGVQHYEPVDFFGGDSQFVSQQRHDCLKKEFAMSQSYVYFELDCRDALRRKAEIQSEVSRFLDGLS